MERGTLLADRYEGLRRLGRGGMGEVWAARDRVLRRDVAIKLLLVDEGLSSDLPARFEREAVAAAQINHPNVVALYDRGVHEDVVFLVMELIDGMPLSTLIHASGVLPLARALELAEQICAALEATHAAGVVHYDIKPRNVMITAAGAAKVVDFGIAGLLQAKRLTMVHSSHLSPAATLEYAAPEQLTAERGDTRSDLYALGGILFAMLTGRAPFTGHNAWAVMAAKISSDAPHLDQVRPGLPTALTDLVARMLEREPALRPQHARVVREQLARLRATSGEDDAFSSTTTLEERLPQPPVPAEAARAAAFTARAAIAASASSGSGPRQLPPDTGLFTGRHDELEHLLDLADRAGTGGSPGTVVISAIDGMGGVGKTALAVRAAHRLAPHFPDGQLFLDLYGFTKNTAPRDPGDALAALLGSLGVPPQRLPADLEARAAFYRDRLAGTRTLILLDNAADEAQVAPLLPAADTCLVLVTSRRRLITLDDALPLSLDVLPRQEAVALLRKAGRLDDDPHDEPMLEQAAELCGRLPLALLIAGALLRTGGKAWDLALLIDRLSSRSPGHELAGYTDETRSLTAVFDLSYRHLPEDLRPLLRCMGLLPGPEVDAYAAAALLATDSQTAGRLLQRLSDHSLLTRLPRGRYRPHDLIRAHGRTLALTLDSEPEREAAIDRVLQYYAYTAQSASRLIDRYPKPVPDGSAPPHVPALINPDTARAWLRTEHPNLDAAFTYAHTHRLDGPTIALAAGLAEILRVDGPWSRAIEIHQTARDTAEHSKRPAAHAAALADLGWAHAMTGNYPEAINALTHALEAFRAQGNGLGEATTLNELGRVRTLTGQYPGAVAAFARALECCCRLGNRLGEATTLNDLGRVQSLTGDYPGAEDGLTRAFEIFRLLGNRVGEASALIELGRVRRLTGDYPGAGDAQTRAIEIFRELGNRNGEASALADLGRVRHRTGDYSGAVEVHSRALELFRELGNRNGEATALSDLARVRSLRGDYPAAIEAHTRALEIYRTLGQRGDEAWALNAYAATLAAMGSRERALALYQQALATNRELDKPDDEAVSLEGIAEHHLATGETRQGAAHLHQALEIYQRLGMRADIERVRTRLASSAGD